MIFLISTPISFLLFAILALLATKQFLEHARDAHSRLKTVHSAQPAWNSPTANICLPLFHMSFRSLLKHHLFSGVLQHSYLKLTYFCLILFCSTSHHLTSLCALLLLVYFFVSPLDCKFHENRDFCLFAVVYSSTWHTVGTH